VSNMVNKGAAYKQGVLVKKEQIVNDIEQIIEGEG